MRENKVKQRTIPVRHRRILLHVERQRSMPPGPSTRGNAKADNRGRTAYRQCPQGLPPSPSASASQSGQRVKILPEPGTPPSNPSLASEPSGTAYQPLGNVRSSSGIRAMRDASGASRGVIAPVQAPSSATRNNRFSRHPESLEAPPPGRRIDRAVTQFRRPAGGPHILPAIAHLEFRGQLVVGLSRDVRGRRGAR